jgi:hypothetical protein
LAEAVVPPKSCSRLTLKRLHHSHCYIRTLEDIN